MAKFKVTLTYYVEAPDKDVAEDLTTYLFSNPDEINDGRCKATPYRKTKGKPDPAFIELEEEWDG